LKTIIITDLLQTFFLLLSVVLSIYFIAESLDMNIVQAFDAIKESTYSQTFFWDDFMGDTKNFFKLFLGGIFVTLAMFGLDQDMMQKNISMKTIGEAQKNMLSFTLVFVIINIFFLSVGAMLYLYAANHNIDVTALPTPDHLFPEIALNYLPILPGIIFMIGLTALTTSFCVDFLNFHKKENPNDPKLVTQRTYVHVGFSLLMLLVILGFRIINDDSVVTAIFTAAGYTYGPLLGLFVFGMFTK